MSYFSNLIRSEEFVSNLEGITIVKVELHCEGTESDYEYNVRTTYQKVERPRASKFMASDVSTVESHNSMKTALVTYNEELRQLGDPDYLAHRATN